MKHGKNYATPAQVDREELLAVTEAVEKVKALSTAKFDEDRRTGHPTGGRPSTRRADRARHAVTAAGTGKRTASRSSPPAKRPRPRETPEPTKSAPRTSSPRCRGFLDFDVAIGDPGPDGSGRWTRPSPRTAWSDANPKTGTVTMDVAKAVTEFKGGRVEYRTDKIGNVQLRVGKVSFSRDDLIRTCAPSLTEVVRVKPASAKGRYIMSITISSTMGPGVKVDPTKVKDLEEVAVPA